MDVIRQQVFVTVDRALKLIQRALAEGETRGVATSGTVVPANEHSGGSAPDRRGQRRRCRRHHRRHVEQDAQIAAAITPRMSTSTANTWSLDTMSNTSPTVVLVHGALTDASVWHPVIARLQRGGHRVLAPAMAMRSLAADAAYLHSVLATIPGPIVLAGHSYGGSVISHPAAITPGVGALVFVAAFQQDAGETAGELNYRFPGSRLTPDTTQLREYAGGSDLYLRPECFADVYAGDLAADQVAVMAAAQHPLDPAALSETFAGQATWRSLPSWALVSTSDRSIPTEALRFMAARAGSTVVETDASHAVPLANPDATADLIADAARNMTTAHSTSRSTTPTPA